MAKAQRSGGRVVRVAGQVKTSANRAVAKARKPVEQVQVTLGDLIAAAFDVAGETKAAAKLVASRSMEQLTGRHIVVVG
ncbi:chaperonin [Melittangium boletus]|uniref:chaperonin n=1 Tax=Melittangium boletus TaxID=83453 RepID=UPI003DA34E3D